MSTGLPISTVALSVHNAIAAIDRPATLAEIGTHLRRLWDDRLTDAEIADAVAQGVGRGVLRWCDDGRLDVARRVGRRDPNTGEFVQARPVYTYANRRDEPGHPDHGWW